MLWQYSDGDPLNGAKLRFLTNIWVRDRWLVECSLQFRQ